jgi:putative GTP pyrophosphokinase
MPHSGEIAMAFVQPGYSKNQVNKAGSILINPEIHSAEDQAWATGVLANWRACHGYPMNTFQATLRKKLKQIDADALVAQRLKRTPSIILKLQRFDGMQLARMQDIGGLRAVLATIGKTRKLESAYRNAKFKHQLVSSKNYIDEPKEDGYRSIHLIYRYANDGAPAYNGLSLELQLRTRLQHAWATAVETMGTFLGQALKSGQGEGQWRSFFAKASAAIAVVEKTAPVPGFEGRSVHDVFSEVARAERELRVLEKLEGFAIAADQITTEQGQGAYHLIVLDSAHRQVSIRPYPVARLEQANLDYAAVEQRTKAGEPIEAVLVSAGRVDALRKAYPNYFLDTNAFVEQIRMVIAQAAKRGERIPAKGLRKQ